MAGPRRSLAGRVTWLWPRSCLSQEMREHCELRPGADEFFFISVSLRLRVELSARVGQRAAAVLAPFDKLLYSSDAYRLTKL
jgi:hypothetical protein